MKDLTIPLTKLKELFAPIASNFSSSKKQYLNSILETIITELNYREDIIGNLNAKLSGFKNKDDYDNEYNRVMDILILLGADSLIYIQSFRKDYVDWMIEHRKELKRPFTIMQLVSTYQLMILFATDKERMPLYFTELKQFMDVTA